MNHLFLHCEVARDLWAHVLKIMDYCWVMPPKVLDVLFCWKRKFDDPHALFVWNLIPLCIWWTLWRERNDRCFENTFSSMEGLRGQLMSSLFCWAKAVLGFRLCDFFEFLSFVACLT